MALTQNEELIIKHIAQNYVNKNSIPTMIPTYSRIGAERYSATWLSKTSGGESLIPIQNAFYFVQNEYRIVMWTGSTYKDVNEPDVITQSELDNMWN